MTTEAEHQVSSRSEPTPPARMEQAHEDRKAAMAAAASRSPELAKALQEAAAAITSRPPTGRPTWPLLLLEGSEKVGKSWLAAQFTGSKHLSASYVLDLNEGTADEYGAVPGADYQVIQHDGTWRSIVREVRAVAAYGQALLDAGERPLCLVIDSGTAEWKLNTEWAEARARKRMYINDPDAEIKVTVDLWNDATTRHDQLFNLLMRFPGIVIVTARGGEVAEIKNGQPTGNKVYRVEGHKNMAFDATIWVQLSRTHPGIVMGCRSVEWGIRPGKDKPTPIEQPDWTVEWLLFEVLKYGEKHPEVRHFAELYASGDEAPESKRFSILFDLLTRAADVTQLNDAWRQVGPAVKAEEMTADEGNQLKAVAAGKHAELVGNVPVPQQPVTDPAAAAEQDDANTRPAGADQ